MKDIFRPKHHIYGQVPPQTIKQGAGSAVPQWRCPVTRRLYETDLDRGLPFARDGRQNRSERAMWADPAQVAAEMQWQPGGILLGTCNGERIGYMDDRPMVTVASARSGKSSTVILPTLYTYPGSMLILDPKGELAREAAQFRAERLGSRVHVIDPFDCSGDGTLSLRASFNPLEEIDASSEEAVGDADMIGQSLVLSDGGSRGGDGSYWTQSAQYLLRGLILWALRQGPSERNLATVREMMTLRYQPLLDVGAEVQEQRREAGERFDLNAFLQEQVFAVMMNEPDAFDGAMAAVGSSFIRKETRERSGVLGTLETETRLLDAPQLRRIMRRSSFRMAELAERPTTIFLCLPVKQMQSHFRWLRLTVQLALNAMERHGHRHGRWQGPPVLFLLEEMATLGYMASLEKGAAYYPGFGVKLWCVLQDISQLKQHYRESWEVFLSNAGLLQFFATVGEASNGYIASRVGMTRFALHSRSLEDLEGEAAHKEKLIYPAEIERIFSRESGAQGILIPGRPPIACARLTHQDVASLQT